MMDTYPKLFPYSDNIFLLIFFFYENLALPLKHAAAFQMLFKYVTPIREGRQDHVKSDVHKT